MGSGSTCLICLSCPTEHQKTVVPLCREFDAVIPLAGERYAGEASSSHSDPESQNVFVRHTCRYHESRVKFRVEIGFGVMSTTSRSQ